jgi:hypothetical protein
MSSCVWRSCRIADLCHPYMPVCCKGFHELTRNVDKIRPSFGVSSASRRDDPVTSNADPLMSMWTLVTRVKYKYNHSAMLP